ncbi:MAG TPA: hypothetical protein VHJ17_20005 [Thermomonospora sp.]|nr:hypothetical protein [Thermomonospora sp.]
MEHLPADSALACALHGESARWSVTDHLLAAVADHLAVANWMFAVAHGDPDAEQPPPPEPVPRPAPPGERPGDAPVPEGAGPAQIAAFLSAL